MKRDRKCRGSYLLLALILSGLVGGCTSADQQAGTAGTDTELPQRSVRIAETPDINGMHLRDKDVLYQNDDETSVVTMYLTVRRGNKSENTNHSWEEINTYSVYDYEDMGVPRYQAAALLQVGDENGPAAGELGYGETVPNATVQIRGQTSSRGAQKNYKIELKKNKGNWRGQRTINLNKHQSDHLRFRNKLAYDLIKGIPQMMSLRTQFVHLYVKDETGDTPGEFEDYGLFTQVEQLNKTGMKAHGLDSEGQLYKVNYFEFYRYEDVILPADDPDYDLEAFEKMLEVKGNSDHTKLIKMLDAVNNYSIPIDTVLDDYFDRENIQYWMAFQILTGNVDTQSRNMYLYSPLNADTWYILTWDNDDNFKIQEERISGFVGRGSWESGISNYWGNVLFQRCLKSEQFKSELDQAILELKDYLNEERLSSMIEGYRQVTDRYAFSMPDIMYIGVTPEEYDRIADGIPGEVEENYQLYLESLEKPMPFHIGVPEVVGNKLKIMWDPSYDFDAENITYTVEVGRDYLFRDWILKKEDVILPEAEIALPPPGQYFIRVRARNKSGQEQDAFDYYVTDEGKHFGTKCFYVNADGTIEEDIYEE